MTRKLASYVTVRDGNSRPITFGPADDHVPAWASAQITHEAAWATDIARSTSSSEDVTTDAQSEPERPKRGRPRKSSTD